ncbi:MAG: PEP-CTERM sorting domain-containing protein [Pirellulaceae bacterium]
MLRTRSTKVFAICMAYAFGLVACARGMADWKDDIGWTQLLTEKGTVENGSGIVVSMAEAPGDVNGTLYLPDLASSQFAGKTIIDGTGNAAGSTSHATSVANFYFGNTISIANGVNTIVAFEANDWINNQLNFDSGEDPVVHNFAVQNHSWIGNDPDDVAMANICQRADFVVNRDDVTIVAGTTNSGNIPDLMAHSYNVISVGRTDGGHGSGTTRFYGPGRTRPHIVAPAGATSFSTPMVSAAATILHDRGAGTDATHSETIRAVLLAGATKEECVGWDRTATRPLDEVYGAGELNIYNSYNILEGGEFAGSLVEPTIAVGDHGWDYESSFAPGSELFYDFEIGPNSYWEDLSIILTWNIDVTDLNASASVFDPTTSLADFNLEFYDSSGSFMGLLLDSSVSTIDNVEHLYFDTLASGRYTLRLTGDTDTGFALAWRATAVPEPTALILIMLAAGMGLVSVRRRHTNQHATVLKR